MFKNILIKLARKCSTLFILNILFSCSGTGINFHRKNMFHSKQPDILDSEINFNLNDSKPEDRGDYEMKENNDSYFSEIKGLDCLSNEELTKKLFCTIQEMEMLQYNFKQKKDNFDLFEMLQRSNETLITLGKTSYILYTRKNSPFSDILNNVILNLENSVDDSNKSSNVSGGDKQFKKIEKSDKKNLPNDEADDIINNTSESKKSHNIRKRRNRGNRPWIINNNNFDKNSNDDPTCFKQKSRPGYLNLTASSDSKIDSLLSFYRKLLNNNEWWSNFNSESNNNEQDNSLKIKKCFKILDLAESATDSEIKKKYKKLAAKYHPDKNRNNQAAASQMFMKVSEAYLFIKEVRNFK